MGDAEERAKVWFTAQVTGTMYRRVTAIALYLTETEWWHPDEPPSLEEDCGTIDRAALDALVERYEAGTANPRQRLKGGAVVRTALLVREYRRLMPSR